MSRKFRWFVIASVMLNILLIGVVAGQGYRQHGGGMQERGERIAALLERSSLPENRRAALKEKLEAVFHNESREEEKRQWREKTLAALTAEPFDAQAYRAQLEEMLERRQRQQREMTGLMVEIASQINRAERGDLAGIFRESRR